MPISLATINSFYNTNLRPFEVPEFIAGESKKEAIREMNTLEDKAVSLIGRPLYEAFIKGYTWKQWDKDPRELPSSIITRLPVRTNYNTDYFDDPWQGLPLDGYSALISNILAHPNIEVRTGLDWRDLAERRPKDCRIFYSGPIDEFFHYSLGALEWRTLRFECNVEPYSDFQGCPVLNRADLNVPFTRTHEFKHLHPERGKQGERTVIMREYPKPFVPGDEPFYPVNTAPNQELLRAYQQKALSLPHMVFGGRLGAYKYYDMDTVIADALGAFDSLKRTLEERC
jgi:UDP-galactopyranose mutase